MLKKIAIVGALLVVGCDELRKKENEFVQGELDHYANSIAAEAIEQYEMAKRNDAKLDACMQAGMVTAAYLDAKNEPGYVKWRAIQKAACKRAGLDMP